jgi:hypothetical protein
MWVNPFEQLPTLMLLEQLLCRRSTSSVPNLSTSSSTNNYRNSAYVAEKDLCDALKSIKPFSKNLNHENNIVMTSPHAISAKEVKTTSLPSRHDRFGLTRPLVFTATWLSEEVCEQWWLSTVKAITRRDRYSAGTVLHQ